MFLKPLSADPRWIAAALSQGYSPRYAAAECRPTSCPVGQRLSRYTDNATTSRDRFFGQLRQSPASLWCKFRFQLFTALIRVPSTAFQLAPVQLHVRRSDSLERTPRNDLAERRPIDPLGNAAIVLKVRRANAATAQIKQSRWASLLSASSRRLENVLGELSITVYARAYSRSAARS